MSCCVSYCHYPCDKSICQNQGMFLQETNCSLLNQGKTKIQQCLVVGVGIKINGMPSEFLILLNVSNGPNIPNNGIAGGSLDGSGWVPVWTDIEHPMVSVLGSMELTRSIRTDWVGWI